MGDVLVLFCLFVQNPYRNNSNQAYASSLAFAWLKSQVCSKYRQESHATEHQSEMSYFCATLSDVQVSKTVSNIYHPRYTATKSQG